MEGLNDALIELRRGEHLLLALSWNSTESKEIARELKSLAVKIEKQKIDADYFIKRWDKEQYLEAMSVFDNSIISSAQSFGQKAKVFQEEILTLDLFRTNIESDLQSLQDDAHVLGSAAAWYLQQDTITNAEHLSSIREIAVSYVNTADAIVRGEKSDKDIQSIFQLLRAQADQELHYFTNVQMSERLLNAWVSVAVNSTVGVADCASLKIGSDAVLDWNSKADSVWTLWVANISSQENISLDAMLTSRLKFEVNKSNTALEDGLATLSMETAINKSFEAIAESWYQLGTQNNSSLNITIPEKTLRISIDPLFTYLDDHCHMHSRNRSLPPEISTFIAYTLYDDMFSKFQSDLVVDYPYQLSVPVDTCCFQGLCKPCCADETCQNEIPSPVLFIHGHQVNDGNSPHDSMRSFTLIQQLLQEEGYLNLGQLDLEKQPGEVTFGGWSRNGHPVSVRSSYYLITHYALGSYAVSVQQSERIENYALRLSEIIDAIRYRTGADHVDIVGHSMGGLVLREYMKLFGDDKVGKVILINTPNKGINGRVAKWCSFLGASNECTDMKTGSVFLNRLNAGDIHGDRFNIIGSSGCTLDDGRDGDGIVAVEDVFLDDSTKYLLSGNCTDFLGTDLHSDVLNPAKHPETFRIIKAILEDTPEDATEWLVQ
ncbi:MAG: esterase/lipase family protein [Candidatus Thorarchaeota archaeon]